VKEYGDIPEELEDMLQDDMTFRLDPLKAFETEKGSPKSRQTFGGTGDDPMWASASSGPGDWFFADEGS
jgi:hypothetical protein